VDAQVSVQERLPTEAANAAMARVPGPVPPGDVLAKGGLARERRFATLERLAAVTMHRSEMALEVILAICRVAALRTVEALLHHRPSGWPKPHRRASPHCLLL